MLGECDVVVADGFSGNIALKSIEGCGKLILSTLKKGIHLSVSSKIGYLFMRKAIKRMRAQLDFDKAGGALLLGLKKPVIKSHGSSKPETIAKLHCERGGAYTAASSFPPWRSFCPTWTLRCARYRLPKTLFLSAGKDRATAQDGSRVPHVAVIGRIM